MLTSTKELERKIRLHINTLPLKINRAKIRDDCMDCSGTCRGYCMDACIIECMNYDKMIFRKATKK